MNGKALTALHRDRAVLVLVIWVLGCLLFVSQAEAVLTAQSISGTVEVLLAGEQTWKPLTATIKLKTGDQIKTGPNSSVDLWFEDGSVLNLAEGTQMSISQLEVSTDQKSRIARFKLWWGAVTAKVTKLAYTENVCEVETETVVAGVKFSEMTVIQPQNTSQSEVVARQGLIEIRQIGEGTVKFSAFLSPKGIAGVSSKVGTIIRLGVYKVVQKITWDIDGLLDSLEVLIEGEKDLVKVSNDSNTPINLMWQEVVFRLGGGAIASFGAPPGLQRFVVMPPGDSTKGSASTSVRPGVIICSKCYAMAQKGLVEAHPDTPDKKILNVGEPFCSGASKGRGIGPGVQGEPQLPTEPGGEQPVTPGGPEGETPRGSDPPKEPTVEPTVEPTPEKEEWDEQDWEEWNEEHKPPEQEEEEEEEEKGGGSRVPSPPPTATPGSPT